METMWCLCDPTPSGWQNTDQSAGGKLRDKNAKESWALLEDLALYDNESWNDPRDFAKPVKEISLLQDVPSTSDRRLIKLENQVPRLMESHLAPNSPVQVNKIASSCKICSGSYDTHYCMENPEQAFVDSRTDEVGGKWFTFKPEQNNLCDTYNPSWRSHPNLSEEESEEDESIVTGELGVEYFERFPTRSELIYHKEDPEGIRGISNFTGRIRGMHIFVGNFTYVSDFMIVEDISSIINHRLSQVVLGKLFVEISNMTHDLSLGIVRNEDDKRRGVEYVMNKIWRFYKECLKLGSKYLIGLEEGCKVIFDQEKPGIS
ncbi:hypothetical protein Tco_0132934 [Tanacetum coccineum]